MFTTSLLKGEENFTIHPFGFEKGDSSTETWSLLAVPFSFVGGFNQPTLQKYAKVKLEHLPQSSGWNMNKSWKMPPASFGLLGIQTSRNAHDLSIPNGIDQVAQHLKAWLSGMGDDFFP